MTDITSRIARRAALEVPDGGLVNLGIGLPLSIPQFLPAGTVCVVHQEAGYIGMGPAATPETRDATITDAAGNFVTLLPGAACFDSLTSFAIVRSGRLDCAVLGALEVDQQGNLANWIIPGKWAPGIGGGMELAQKARKVIATLRHTDKDGRPKILKTCSLPLTAPHCVSVIVTELAVFRVKPEGGLVLVDLLGETTLDEVQAKTEAGFETRLEARVP